MENWKDYKLGEVAEDIAMGPFGSNLKTDNFIASGVPVIRGGNLNENGFNKNNFVYVSEEKANSLKRCLAYPDDLVFTHRGTLGQVGIVPHGKFPKYLVSQSQMRLRVNKNYLVPKFLYYFFKSSIGQSELLKNVSQVGVPAIANPTKSLKEVNIKIPSIQEQLVITQILSSLDDKIDLNRRISAILEEIAKMLFKAWFVDFEPIYANIEKRLSATISAEGLKLFPSEFEHELPKGWKTEKLGDVLEVKGGTTPSTKNERFWDGENYWATPKDLSNIKFPVLLTTDRKITTEGVQQISSGILPKGTLLLSSRAPIGYLAISQIPISINQGFIAIQGKKVSNLFMLYWLIQNMELVKSRANGSTFQEINKSSFREIEITLPNKELLNLFEEKINPLFEKIISNEIEIARLGEFRDSLLPRFLSGKIPVNSLENETRGINE